MNNISVRHLTAFLAIAQCGSFTRAAKHLNVTQSTLTATIKQLEQYAQLRLFDRTTRSVTLTKEGIRFQPIANRLVKDFNLALGDLQAGSDLQRGQVTLVVSPSANYFLLPPLLEHFHQQYPQIDIAVYEAGAREIEQQVIAKVADFAIGSNNSQHPDIHYQPILQDRYGIVTLKEHPLASLDCVTWHALDPFPILHLSPDNGIRAQLEQLRVQGEISFPKRGALIESSTPGGLGALIQRNMGIAILPALAAQALTANGMKFTPLTEPTVSRELCILQLIQYQLSPSAEAMLKLLKKTINKKPLNNQDNITYL